MRLISLNTWGGTRFDPLMAFIAERAATTDIFCLQEVMDNDAGHQRSGSVRANLFEELTRILPNHRGRLATIIRDQDYDYNQLDFELREGLAIFYSNDLADPEVTVTDLAERPDPINVRKLQTLAYSSGGKRVFINNFHGLWVPGGKNDNDDRLDQSRKIRAVIDRQSGPKLLSGDFNLWPDTESLAMLQHGLSNLVTEHGITDTRTKYYDSRKFRSESPHVRMADYILASPEITVARFDVPNLPVSDHRPMLLEFSL